MLDNRRQLFTKIKFGNAERLSKRQDHGWIDRTGFARGDQPLANPFGDVRSGRIDDSFARTRVGLGFRVHGQHVPPGTDLGGR